MPKRLIWIGGLLLLAGAGACGGEADSDSGQDGRNNGEADPCERVTCSFANSSCQVRRGIGTCQCDAGFTDFGAYGCHADDDEDGVPDTDELEIARAFAPRLVFGAQEETASRVPHWAVAAGEGFVTIFYALSYRNDGGDLDWGATAHVGDPEFIVVAIIFDGDDVEEVYVYLSAHYGADTDASRWYVSADLVWDERGDGAHPVVWVAENKHANYHSAAACEAGAVFQDQCSDAERRTVEVRPDRNLGQGWSPLKDRVRIGGNSEWFWTDRRFCGWRVNSTADSGRQDCAKTQNNYARMLSLWEHGELE